nr:protein PF14_0175 isoform X1 [Drosophila bipectinata]
MIHFRYPDCIKVPLSSVVSRCSQNGLDLLEDMLAYDPEKRPTAQQSLKYPYFHALKRISPTAATKANVRLNSKYAAVAGGHHNHHQSQNNVSNNVLPVQEKLQAVTELLHQTNNNNVNNNNSNMNLGKSNNLNHGKAASKNLGVPRKYQPKLSFLTNHELADSSSLGGAATDGVPVQAQNGSESINDIYLNRNISQLFGLPSGTQQHPHPVHHPNVSFSTTSSRNAGAIYVNGSHLGYDAANMNAKNNAKLVMGVPNGGYYVPVARSSVLAPEAKVYNVFSKVSASQAPASILVRQPPVQMQLQPENGAPPMRLSGRSRAAAQEIKQPSIKSDDLDLILGSKLKTSAKRQRNAKANILLEDLFGQLSMDSDSDGKYPHTVPPTQQAKSGATSTGGHRERDRDRDRDRERDLFGDSFVIRPGLRKKATQSSLEVNNGSHVDSLDNSSSSSPSNDEECRFWPIRAQNTQKEKPAAAAASSFPWDETNKTEDEKLTAWMVAENGNLVLGSPQQA